MGNTALILRVKAVFMLHYVRILLQDCAVYLRDHPIKEKAAGRPVVTLPLILYSDDTSGNRSKKWHKFDSWCLLLAGIPRHENSKLRNIRFICCSDSVSALEMTDPIAQELTALEREMVQKHLMLTYSRLFSSWHHSPVYSVTIPEHLRF